LEEGRGRQQLGVQESDRIDNQGRRTHGLSIETDAESSRSKLARTLAKHHHEEGAMVKTLSAIAGLVKFPLSQRALQDALVTLDVKKKLIQGALALHAAKRMQLAAKALEDRERIEDEKKMLALELKHIKMIAFQRGKHERMSQLRNALHMPPSKSKNLTAYSNLTDAAIAEFCIGFKASHTITSLWHLE
jgi:hypothetical protein